MKKIILAALFLLTAQVCRAQGNPTYTGNMQGNALILGSGVQMSSAPMMFIDGTMAATGLPGGTTFFETNALESAITLDSISTVIQQSGVGGSGDTIACNSGVGNGISVTQTAAAAPGTRVRSSQSQNLNAGVRISCHLESTAITKPIISFSIQYFMQ